MSSGDCIVCEDNKLGSSVCLDSKCIEKQVVYKRIYNKNRMSSSRHLAMKKVAEVSKMVGEAGCPNRFSNAGGPGDLTRGVQKRGGLFSFTYGKTSIRNRLRQNNKKGVDKKHNSYDRYLARKVGNVLRKDRIRFETTDYTTKNKVPCANSNCSAHSCLVERIPKCSETDKMTGKSGNPGVCVPSSCANKCCN